jgi:twitching motility two-component system response regulator PilG
MMPLILIIDDSPTIRKILETIMQGEGYRTLSFADGFAALRWLTSPQAIMPALILLDLSMPRMDGFTVLRHLKSKAALAAIPVIVLTICDTTADRRRARLVGASDYIVKPFTTEQIASAVQTQLTIIAEQAGATSETHDERMTQRKDEQP